MVRKVAIVWLAGLALGGAAPVQDDPAGNALSDCLRDRLPPEGAALLIRYAFAAMGSAKVVADLSAVTPAIMNGLNRDVANLHRTMVSRTCRAEAVAAIRANGPDVLETAFDGIGEKSFGALFTDPAITAQVVALDGMIDQATMADLVAEAGRTGGGDNGPRNR